MSSYDYSRVFDAIRAAVAAPGSIGQRMHTVIDACEWQRPHPHWQRLRQVDFDADLPVLKGWLADAWLGGAVRPGDQALWFGLFNPRTDDGSPSADLLLASGPTYDDGADTWRRDLVPEKLSYLDSEVLAELYFLAYASKAGLGHEAEYPLTLAYGAIAACTALALEPLPLALVSLRGAAAGFDNGAALSLGVFDNLRFIPRVRQL